MQENYLSRVTIGCVIETRFRAEGVGLGKEIRGKLLHYIDNYKVGYKLYRIDMDEDVAMEVELCFEKANSIPDLDELHSYFTWLRTDRKKVSVKYEPRRTYHESIKKTLTNAQKTA